MRDVNQSLWKKTIFLTTPPNKNYSIRPLQHLYCLSQVHPQSRRSTRLHQHKSIVVLPRVHAQLVPSISTSRNPDKQLLPDITVQHDTTEDGRLVAIAQRLYRRTQKMITLLASCPEGGRKEAYTPVDRDERRKSDMEIWGIRITLMKTATAMRWMELRR